MKKLLTTLSLLSLLYGFSAAQNCATLFVPGGGSAGLTETCNPSGAAGPYSILVSAPSGTTLEYIGLWEVPNNVVTATVNCNNNTFIIARQPITGTFEIEGTGALNAPWVNISYLIYTVGGSTPVDACSGTFASTTVGLQDAQAGSPTCSLSPNPSHDQTKLVIQGVTSSKNWSYRVIDIQGRIVADGQLDTQLTATIQVSSLAQGVYRVLAQDGKGLVVTKALLVE